MNTSMPQLEAEYLLNKANRRASALQTLRKKDMHWFARLLIGTAASLPMLFIAGLDVPGPFKLLVSAGFFAGASALIAQWSIRSRLDAAAELLLDAEFDRQSRG